jgi:hypothetical protein
MALQSTTALATVTLQAATPTVTFSGIPNTYRDLILNVNYTGSSAAALVFLRFNDDTANYSRVVAYPTASATATNLIVGAVYGTKRTLVTTQILDYSSTDKHKTVLDRYGNAENSEVAMTAGRWASLTAVNKISLIPENGTFAAGSTFSLYGRIA